MGERVVLGRKGASPMIKIRWTDEIPGNIDDVSDAEETGASGRATSWSLDSNGFLEQ